MHGVDVVVHAAALKQVPGVRVQPLRGDQDQRPRRAERHRRGDRPGRARACSRCRTDKAVNPVNLYGATKLCAEKLFVQGNAYAGARDTRFAVRALRQRRRQPRQRDPALPRSSAASASVTITDARMTRFWITLDQGVDFVIRLRSSGCAGGEVFVPQDPEHEHDRTWRARSRRAARSRSSASAPARSCTRCLISDDESRQTVEFDDLFVIKPEHPSWHTGRGRAASRRRRLRVHERHERPAGSRQTSCAGWPGGVMALALRRRRAGPGHAPAVRPPDGRRRRHRGRRRGAALRLADHRARGAAPSSTRSPSRGRRPRRRRRQLRHGRAPRRGARARTSARATR